MTWAAWLEDGRVARHAPQAAEIAAQLRAAERSLADAALDGLSPEGRFQLAYGAALELATAAILAAGYRVSARTGHHQLTFQATGVALGEPARVFVRYFERCRRQRNVISYDGSEVAAEQAAELLAESSRFARLVKRWMDAEHPEVM